MGFTGGLTINGVYGASKIDDYATLGLDGTPDSLAYRVHEVEKHLHSAGSWFEAATTPSGTTHVGDRIGGGAGPYQIDAGNDTWGSWVQVLGSSDTPARTGQAYFDPHEMVIDDCEVNAVYFVQFSRGASGDAGYTAGTYTEVVFYGAKSGGLIIDVQTGRAPAGALLWARCMVPGVNTATLDFYLGIHEYTG